ncbi:hypothetical protein [Streptomyces adelaidensis]|uniref:hypothetical protein n=1 Tax=Streptomyces adelaidensis TaxID=2796465 RepID=UPI001F1F2AE7|nr:hypothetical protein [Streptomyces adelaidensis]
MGAGGIVLLVVFLYLPVVVPFCALVGRRTSHRMGWLMSVPLVLLPLALLIGFMTV